LLFPVIAPLAARPACHRPPTPLLFVQAELEFPRGKLIGLALTRQSASRRVACGTMTTNFDF
jgi:hypothetical protein